MHQGTYSGTTQTSGQSPHVLTYCQTALELFAPMPPERVQAIAFEIAVLGQNELDINNPDKKYCMKELPAEFTGLKLCSFLYVASQQIVPGTDVGIDFSLEYEAAMSMRR